MINKKLWAFFNQLTRQDLEYYLTKSENNDNKFFLMKSQPKGYCISVEMLSTQKFEITIYNSSQDDKIISTQTFGLNQYTLSKIENWVIETICQHNSIELLAELKTPNKPPKTVQTLSPSTMKIYVSLGLESPTTQQPKQKATYIPFENIVPANQYLSWHKKNKFDRDINELMVEGNTNQLIMNQFRAISFNSLRIKRFRGTI